MRFVLWAVIALVALAGLVLIAGWTLPVGHVASSSAHFNQPPEKVYAAITDLGSYRDWWGETNRVEMLEPINGKPRFRQHTTSGPIVIEVDESSPPRRYVTRIADPDQPFGGTWTYELQPEDGGTRLTITERGEIYNPIFRALARFVFGYTSTMESFLAALGKRLGT